MSEQTRRLFLKTTGLGAAAGLLARSTRANAGTADQKAAEGRLRLGMASYTLRKFNIDQALAMTNQLGLKHIAFKSFHLPLESSDEEIKIAAEKVKNAGLDLYGGGVIYMTDEQQVMQAFHYAQTAGMKVIIGVPSYNLLSLCDKMVKETEIILAIHNHGPGDEMYPGPKDVYDRIKGLDKRIGLCMDIGHTQRIGIDPSEAAEKYFDRLYDVHIKDVTQASKEGTTLEVGRGVIDIPKFLKTLVKLKYSGIVSLEYEKDENDPMPGSAESIGYIKGVLSVI